MSNANRDYAIVYDVKNSLLVLSRPLNFYLTDKNTSNIFVKLVTRVIVGDGIDQYTDIENASGYVLTMRVIKPDDEVKSLTATQHESESIFQFDLTEDFKDIPGKYICELTISNIVNGRQEFTTSDPFNYEVKRSILSNVKNIIEGKDTTVEKLLNDLDATKAELSSQIKDIENRKLNKDGVIHEANLGQDVLQKFTGGNVAVTQVGATNIQNLHDIIAKNIGEYVVVTNNYTWTDGYYNYYKKVIEGGSPFKVAEVPCGYGDRFRITGRCGGQPSHVALACILDSSGNIIDKIENGEYINKEYTIPQNGIKIILVQHTETPYKLELLQSYKCAKNNDLENSNELISKINDSLKDFIEFDKVEKYGYYNYNKNEFVPTDGTDWISYEVDCKKGDKFLITGYSGGNPGLIQQLYEISSDGVRLDTYLVGQVEYNNYIYTVSNDKTTKIRATFRTSRPFKFLKNDNFTNINEYVNNIIDTKFKKYEGKIFTSYGDSWVAQGLWQPTVIEQLGFSKHNNIGLSGYSVSTVNSEKCLCDENNINKIPTDTDVLAIVCLTNDWGLNAPLGDVSYENTDTSTVCGAFNIMIDKIISRIPNAEIWFIGNGFAYQYTSRPNFKNNLINNQGLLAIDYANTIGTLCKYRGLPYYNVGETCGINNMNKEQYYQEEYPYNLGEPCYIHMNETGAKKFANRLIKLITNS